MLPEVCQTRWQEKTWAKYFFHWTSALFSKIFVFKKVLNVTEMKHAKNLREFFVWHKKLLADIAKLDVTRKGSQICFQWNFARFSNPCVFNELFCSLIECFHWSVMLETTGSCRQKPFLLPGTELFFGNFSIEIFFPEEMILKLA